MAVKTSELIQGIVFKRFDINGSVYGEASGSGELFVLKYWLEDINRNYGKNERFKALADDSVVRGLYEEVLKVYQVDNRYIRFVEHLSYVLLRKR